jgi:parallel beta-helix repeat protein
MAKTIKVPGNYGTIQAAINAAAPGDIIEVTGGPYYEHIVINKSITLRGVGNPIIDGQQTFPAIVQVIVNNVEINGFTIKNGLYNDGIFIEKPGAMPLNTFTICNNIIKDNYIGIWLSRCTNVNLYNNTLVANQYGIRIYESSFNKITKNIIDASLVYGLYIYSNSKNNTIESNSLSANKYCIYLEWSNYNTISLNKINSSKAYGIRLSWCTATLVKGNDILKNAYGVYIWNCSGNTFYHNNFISNTIQADKYDADLKKNLWDTNIPGGAEGNYWSDYTGVDDGSGIGRWGEPRKAKDGIGDTKIPHSQVTGVSWFGLDWYPLMHPWTPIPPGPAPVAIFTWSPLEPIYSLPATFNASKSYSINGTIISYKWNFGDGNITTRYDPIIIHTFAAAGNYNVTLTVTDNDNLTNSTSHVVKVLLYKLEIDVYTQQPEPYSGRGPNQPSDAFAPQSNVILYAEVTYNYEPVENKPVTFAVTDPNGELVLSRSNNTDAYGIASTDFTLATNATFGVYTVLTTVEVSGRTANDTLTFLVGWIIELIKIDTLDENGASKNVFTKGEYVYFDLRVKNIAFTTRNATLTINVYDECNVTVGLVYLQAAVPSGMHEYSLLQLGIKLPTWCFIGRAKAIACAFTDWPLNGEVPYCPEILTEFHIKATA